MAELLRGMLEVKFNLQLLGTFCGEIWFGPLCQIELMNPGNKRFVEAIPSLEAEIKDGHQRFNKGKSKCSDEIP